MRTGVGVAHDVIGARDKCSDVGGHAGRGVEVPHGHPGAGRYGIGRGCIADHLPVIWRCHRQLEGRLQVWLLEARIHSSSVGRFELRVEVRLIVDRVDESMKTLTGVHIAALRDDRDRVVAGKIRKSNSGTVDDVIRVELTAVEGHGLHIICDQIDPGGRPWLLALEDARRGAAEGGAGTREIEIDRVRVNKEGLAAGVGFRTGDVFVSRRRRHRAIFAPDARRCLPRRCLPRRCLPRRCRWRSAHMTGLGNTPGHGFTVDRCSVARIRERQLRGCALRSTRSSRCGQHRPPIGVR